MKKYFPAMVGLTLCLSLSVLLNAQGGKKNTSCGTNIPLVVTVDDNIPIVAGVNGNIVSDGQVSYSNGGSKNNKITAIMQLNNCTFDFTLNLNFSTRHLKANLPDGRTVTSQFFNIDRVASVPITTSPAYANFCAEGVVYNADGITIRSNADGSYQDNYAGCGADAGGNYVRRAASFTLYESGQSDHRLVFQNASLDVNGSVAAGTAYVKVYHPTSTVWIIIPENGFNNGMGEVARLFTNANGTYLSAGDYLMPFRFTVTKQ